MKGTGAWSPAKGFGRKCCWVTGESAFFVLLVASFQFSDSTIPVQRHDHPAGLWEITAERRQFNSCQVVSSCAVSAWLAVMCHITSKEGAMQRRDQGASSKTLHQRIAPKNSEQRTKGRRSRGGTNPPSIHEDAGSIPGLTQVKGPVLLQPVV